MEPVTLAPERMAAEAVRKLLLGGVVPRPIAWTSTIGPEGVPNLAPFSYFTVVSTDPPMLSLTIEARDDGTAKDTAANIVRTGEFVVNVVPEELGEAMWATSADLPSEEDEFAVAATPSAPAHRVCPSRVAQSPLAMECVLERSLPLGNALLVIGRVVCFQVRPDVLDGRGRVAHDRLRALGRVGGRYLGTSDTYPLP
ncbi:flavin reductase family protein [Nocardiopsis lucentensis]|uniref:flavin reductase family protein n=1 Tax=Nocardiopsis lucentensis TaxID=53441 RepID=UPI00034D2676|nr:flavin reductase family protein [Nocardiopsis lucentensis]